MRQPSPYPVIRITDLTFAYREHPVLEGVELEIPQGELASIVGPNGGGKTTLLKLILGLLRPGRGRIELFGKPPQEGRLKVGYLPQYSHYDPLFPVSVLNVVLMGQLGCRRQKFLSGYSRQARQTARAALERVGLADRAGDSFHQLSGGQRQRVLIARALATEPRLLLLDEPTANIDPRSEESFYELLAGLNREMTILLVSHDLGLVSQVVRSVICVNRQVVIHPTSAIDGTLIREIYGGDFNLIRHDHRCSGEGHQPHRPNLQPNP